MENDKYLIYSFMFFSWIIEDWGRGEEKKWSSNKWNFFYSKIML